MKWIFLLLAGVFMQSPISAFEIQGHRGSRGTMPENTLPGFFEALRVGARSAELDLMATQDGEIIIHHDYFLPPRYTTSNGKPIALKEAIFELPLEVLQTFDIGRIPNPLFPRQKALKHTIIPTLSDLLKAFTLLPEPKAKNFYFNLEIKRKAKYADKTLPAKDLAQKVISIVHARHFDKKVVYSSFDPEVLLAVREIEPNARIGFINEESLDEILEMAEVINIAAPKHTLLETKDDVGRLHAAGLLVIPWTVNDKERCLELIEMGVDGITTDYPEDMVNLVKIKESFKELGVTVSKRLRRKAD